MIYPCDGGRRDFLTGFFVIASIKQATSTFFLPQSRVVRQAHHPDPELAEGRRIEVGMSGIIETDKNDAANFGFFNSEKRLNAESRRRADWGTIAKYRSLTCD